MKDELRIHLTHQMILSWSPKVTNIIAQAQANVVSENPTLVRVKFPTLKVSHTPPRECRSLSAGKSSF